LQYWAPLLGPNTTINSIVAVIDTGYEPGLHPELDKNVIGVFDPVTGATGDAAYGDLDPLGHGKYIAGLIASSVGVAVHAKLLIVRAAARSPDGSVVLNNGRASIDMSAAAKGIIWAVDNGALIVNCSWGGVPPTQEFQSAINDALSSGVIIFGAEGNNSQDRDLLPATWEVRQSDVCRITDATANGDLVPDAAFGPGWVDTAVQVQNNGGTGLLAVGSTPTSFVSLPPGTSGATAIASAIGGLLRDQLPWYQVIPRMLGTVDRAPACAGKVWSGGVVDISHSLDLSKPSNVPLDQLNAAVQVKNGGKKLVVIPTSTFTELPIPSVRIWVNDALLKIVGSGSKAKLSGKFPNGTQLLLQSSLGGEISEVLP